jgi:hypothetical protein
VKELSLEGVNMASIDLRCYADVQKLTIRRCSNVNLPIDSLRLLRANRDSKNLVVAFCIFDTQTTEAINALKLSKDLNGDDEAIYFRTNKVAPAPVIFEQFDY